MKNELTVNTGLKRALLFFCLIIASCGGDDSSGSDNPIAFAITIDPSVTHQEMIGFGGALSWYCTRVTSSPSEQAIADLIFSDLGIDIIRFKTWYYPDNYPTVTSTTNMSDDNSRSHWDATNELYTLAKNRNANIKILLSSWGPPPALKSNNSTRQGTLKKDGDEFMYDEYADYWEHTLDNLPFNPEYISIQNEPTYINAGWTTCEWSSVETAALPGYHIAFDKVYDKIKNRANPPVMIGPESQDVPTFAAFANILKDKAHCGALAYHPYNFNASSSNEQIVNGLKSIGTFTAKPNIMTEYSDNLNWFNTALFIQNTLLHANSSGYIYWKLAWAEPAAGAQNAGMVSIAPDGTYSVTPFYHLIKHYAKYIDAGYHRVNASSANANVSVAAFKNPEGTKLTLVLINQSPGTIRVNFNTAGENITDIAAYQSKESSYFKTIEVPAGKPVELSSQSITTVVLDI